MRNSSLRILLYILIIMLLLASCNNETVQTNRIPNTSFLMSGEITSLHLEDNVAYSDLPLFAPVEYHDLKKFSQQRFFVISFSSYGNYVSNLCNDFRRPVLNIQIIGEDYIGCVYKVSENQLPECCMVIIFTKDDTTDRPDDYLNWVITGETYYLNPTKIFSYSDFSDITVGCSVDELCAIDYSVNYDLYDHEMSPKEYAKIEKAVEEGSASISDDFQIEYYSLYKILRDGIYFVEYGAADKIITDILFYPFSEWEGVPYVSVNNADFLEDLFAE